MPRAPTKPTGTRRSRRVTIPIDGPLDRHEAAAFCRVSVDAIDLFTHRKDHPLPRLQCGRKFLFLREDLIRWCREEAERARSARRRRRRRGGAA